MNVMPLDNSQLVVPPTAVKTPKAGDTFEETLDAATKLVSSAFVLPALESLRDSPFADGPLAPGPVERRFGPLLDTHIADRITKSANFRLPHTIAERMLAGRNYA
jgi:hypothetical protein